MVDKIVVGHLYPKQMNVYGDMGNVITLKYRMQQRGIKVEYVPVQSLISITDHKIDILVGGGGQDSNQTLVQDDLQRYSSELKAQCGDGMVALMICGMYQLFGNRFVLSDTSEINGIGVIDLETHANQERLIGNVVINSKYGQLVGFENHSGRTYLGNGVEPLGTVIKGAGNNGETKDEGAVVKNVFGTYMHGPALTKNPVLADELIIRAIERKTGVKPKLEVIDDFLELQAASIAMKRPR